MPDASQNALQKNDPKAVSVVQGRGVGSSLFSMGMTVSKGQVGKCKPKMLLLRSSPRK